MTKSKGGAFYGIERFAKRHTEKRMQAVVIADLV